MGIFDGQLKTNEIFSALYNMIISQEVFADNISKGGDLVDKARVDGTLYGDTKLYYATDALKSVPWGNDAEATNLLALHRPPSPSCQAIYLDTFRQISLTIDNYLSKRAWATEGAFASFNSIMLGWIRDTKYIYDTTNYNTYIGTTKTTLGKQNRKVVLATTLTAEERAKYIAQDMANLFVEMSDVSRDFNDYGYLRKYKKEAIKVVWNSKYVNEVRKIDLPTIFHKDGLMEKFEEDVLPKRYFGDLVDATTISKGTPDADNPVKVSGSNYTYEPISGNKVVLHINEECDLPVYNTDTSAYESVHFFAGDELPDKTALKGTFTVDGSSKTIDFKNKVYKADETIICKVMLKYPPYMSAFEVGTSFFNPKSLTENHYLTWGHNSIEYLKNYPYITLYESAS